MKFVDKQTIKDLEFNNIRDWLSSYALNPTAKSKLEKLTPSNDFQLIKQELGKLQEYFLIKTEGEAFPILDFKELNKELKLLLIKNTVIDQEGFLNIYKASILVNSILVFFDKNEKKYPFLVELIKELYYTNEICDIIDKVFDKKGSIKNDASPILFQIRLKIVQVRNQINKNFEKELKRFHKDGILSEIKETFVNERRVLAINSTHKRKISGSVLGSSKTGSITFIEPQINVQLNNELELLIDDERSEIYKILQELTSEIQGFYLLIKAYNFFLIELDFIQAKTKLAIEFNCSLPSINENAEIELIHAYHPILYRNNRDLKKQTISQSIKLDKFSRFLVISGPNAGGKSITLKTVGLLQLMLQSGLLIPCDSNSNVCLFQQVLSDIGDNQSIQNELSTYSYRLKRMKHFLEVANRKTLMLLDEFGTGSDPELGGALAEVFFEELYNKKSYAVITTHYSNIKLKAEALKNAINGCMMFNTETLEPLYRFSIGQPGSSFTFEVAQMNGISLDLIEKAKSKVSDHKINLDKLLTDLQKEKSYLEKLNKEHIEAQKNAETSRLKYLELKEKLDFKLQQQAQFMEQNSKFISNGKKLSSFIERYVSKSKKKDANQILLEEIKKYISIEKAKLDEVKFKAKLIQNSNKVSKNKPTSKITKDLNQIEKIVVGSEVKLIDSKQKGVVQALDNEIVTVLFGFIKMKVEKNKLIWLK